VYASGASFNAQHVYSVGSESADIFVTPATLDKGGWLGLTLQGLSPCQKHYASWRANAPVLVLPLWLQVSEDTAASLEIFFKGILYTIINLLPQIYKI